MPFSIENGGSSEVPYVGYEGVMRSPLFSFFLSLFFFFFLFSVQERKKRFGCDEGLIGVDFEVINLGDVSQVNE